MNRTFPPVTLSPYRLAFAAALAVSSLTALPLEANAAAKPGCAQIEGSDLSLDAAVQAGLTKKSAIGWYSAGKALADEEFANLAYFALDRAIQVGGTSPVVFSALDCIERIQGRVAILDLPSYDAKLAALAKAAKTSEQQEILARFAFRSVIQRVSAKAKASALNALSPALKSSGPYANAARGMIAATQSDWKNTKTALSAALNALPKDASPKDPSGPLAELIRFKPTLALSLARSLYALGEDAAAIAEYEKLYRIGLPMQDALIESGWAQLRKKNYVKAIGLSYELSTGKLAEFFAPEALSIRAIGFVENCRFAEAKRVIDRFSEVYNPVSGWLRANENDEAPLYEKALARAEGAIGADAVPEKVWSMWSGSDLFIATQRGIQEAFAESRDAPEWIAENSQNARVKALLTDDLKRVAAARSRAALRIENHLEDLNSSMLARISQESERLRFVRIEANQGAGRDLIYRNANPGVVDVEEKVMKQDRRAKSYKGKLDWGKVQVEDPSAESWIDEIGNFEAKALDLCRAKAEFQSQQKQP